MKKWGIIVLGIAVFVLGSIATVLIIRLFLFGDPFRQFLTKQTSLNQIALTGEYSNSDTYIQVSYLFDSAERNLVVERQVKCSNLYNNNLIRLNASVYANEGRQYIQLDEISGIVKQGTDPGRDTSKVFAKVIGNWYEVPTADSSVRSAEKYGIFILDSGIVDSAGRGKSIAEALLKEQAISNIQLGSDGDYKAVLNRNGWANVLEGLYGDKQLEMEQIRAIFGNQSTKNVKIFGAEKDGRFNSINSSTHNYCRDLFAAFTGVVLTNISEQVPGTVKSVPPSSIKPSPPTQSKPFTKIGQDLSI